VWSGGVAGPYVNKPFQVVRPTENHTSMLILPDGLAHLAQHVGSIALVPVVGPYHSGKSFLLNALLGDTQAFPVGRRTTPETMGIWICRTSMTTPDGAEVWLMDSEGFFGPNIEESYDAKIFTIASLLGAHLLYNTVKVIDQQAVGLLEMLARRAQLFRTRSSAEAAGAEVPDFLSSRNFPPLTWVVEDFIQELPSAGWTGEDGATRWLKTYLTSENGMHESGSWCGNGMCGDADPPQAKRRVSDVEADGSVASSDEEGGYKDTGAEQEVEEEEQDLEEDIAARPSEHFITKLYKDIKVHTLFLPAHEKKHLQDLSRLDYADLTPEFREEIADLKRHLVQRLQARRFQNVPMNGRTLASSLQFVVQALQRGFFPELPSLWSSWNKQVADMSLGDAEEWFSMLISAIDAGDDPVLLQKFNEGVERAREKASSFYSDLLHDFDVPLKLNELASRMAVHFERAVAKYHERIHRWMGEAIGRSKENLEQFLADIATPTEPSALEKTCREKTTAIKVQFMAMIAEFSAPGRAPVLGAPAKMPVFSKDPPSHLEVDLQARVASRLFDNDRDIQEVFKIAVNAADNAAEAELKLNVVKLMGNAALIDLRKVVQLKSWQAFDEKLSNYQWMMKIPHYKANCALVEAESLDGRFSRFAQANDQRLATYFNAALDKAKSAYSSRRENLRMPVAVEELDAQHKIVASQIRELLVDQGKDLGDTERYKAAMRNLDGKLREGLNHALEKNLKIWKSHSDEVTRCALKMNRELERRTGLFSTFNKIPWVHKSTCRKHLMQCFSQHAQTDGGTMVSKIAAPMQSQIFDVWYTQDLARDSAAVWTSFYMMFGAIVLTVLAVVWCRSSRRAYQYDRPHSMGQPAQWGRKQSVWGVR